MGIIAVLVVLGAVAIIGAVVVLPLQAATVSTAGTPLRRLEKVTPGGLVLGLGPKERTESQGLSDLDL